ncbi:MAG: DUF402 domain-containing protein [Mycobacteriales bacterium]
MASVRVHKQKYPARSHLTSQLEVIGNDGFGTWLYRPRDAMLDRAGLVLLPRERWWTSWWWIGRENDPTRRWISVDICTPPVLADDGWHYDDLEIDLVRLSDGSILVLDEDEFEDACHSVPYPQEVATAARRTRDEMHLMLENDAEPFQSHGWKRLEIAIEGGA